MRAWELAESLPMAGSKLTGSLQLYVARSAQVTEILKPRSGSNYKIMWTSTAEPQGDGYTSDWAQWVSSEMPQWSSDRGTLYQVTGGARILSMNTDKDAFAVAEHYGVAAPKNPMAWLTWSQKFPWDKIAQDFDAVHHVPASRMSNILMNSWDVESTAWFNARHLKKLGEVKVIT